MENNNVMETLFGEAIVTKYTDKIKEMNKLYAGYRNKQLDAALEMKILQESSGTESPSLKEIAISTDKPYYLVVAKYNIKKIKYKLV